MVPRKVDGKNNEHAIMDVTAKIIAVGSDCMCDRNVFELLWLASSVSFEFAVFSHLSGMALR